MIVWFNKVSNQGSSKMVVLTYLELLSDADGDPETGEDGMGVMTDELSKGN